MQPTPPGATAELVLALSPPRLQQAAQKHLAKLRTRLQLGAETPLVLGDTSTFGGLTQGFVCTEQSLWVLSTGQRVGYEELLFPPWVLGERVVLLLQKGPLWLELPSEPEQLSFLMGLLEALTDTEPGAQNHPLARFALRGPIAEAFLPLRGEQAYPAPLLPYAKRKGAQSLAFPLDLAYGEEPLFVHDATLGGACDEGTVCTNFRVLHSLSHRDPVELPYGSILQLEPKKTFTGSELRFSTQRGPITIDFSGDLAFQLAHVLHRVLSQLPVQHRGLAAPQPPYGQRHLLGHVLQRMQAQFPPELQDDMQQRVALLARTERHGRYAQEAWLLTPLSAGDLEYVFAQLFGPPIQMSPRTDVPGVWHYVFQKVQGSTGGAIASNVVGVGLLLVAGVGWVGGGGRSVTTVELNLAQGHGHTRFALQAFGLEGSELREFYHTIHTQLQAHEMPLMLRRLLLGPQLPAAQLLAVPEPELLQRLGILLTQGPQQPYR